MQRRTVLLSVLLALAASAPGQEQPPTKPPPGKEPPAPLPAKPADGKPAEGGGAYENADLGIVFSGVYGWPAKIASGSGAWTELARYDSDEQNDSFVVLGVRDNPFASLAELRTALGQEFKEAAEPAPGRAAFKEIVFKDVEMKRGINLPGIEVSAVASELGPDGKKRERSLLVRTYYGQSRLFRVTCSARRAREKKVRDLFERAVSGLTVSAVEERAMRGVAFRSIQGSYSCVVPDGFSVVRPPDAWVADAKFESRQGITISVISAPYDLSLTDQIQEMSDYFRDTIKIEEAQVLGGAGFTGVVTKPESVTWIAGIVKDKRVYRVHTAAPPKSAEDAKRVHEAFLKGLKLARQS
jgi:hypothetical protein